LGAKQRAEIWFGRPLGREANPHSCIYEKNSDKRFDTYTYFAYLTTATRPLVAFKMPF
jgi:hypothetical protein